MPNIERKTWLFSGEKVWENSRLKSTVNPRGQPKNIHNVGDRAKVFSEKNSIFVPNPTLQGI